MPRRPVLLHHFVLFEFVLSLLIIVSLLVVGIAKAQSNASRQASEGLVALVMGNMSTTTLVEINSETDFVAKNQDFIKFCKELSDLNFNIKGDILKLNESKMQNGSTVKDNLVNLIAKIGEKIIIRRTNFVNSSNGINFFYVHSAIEKGIGKIISIVKIDGVIKGKNDEIVTKIA